MRVLKAEAPSRRQWIMLGMGFAAMLASFLPPLADIAQQLFCAHMLQHLLLIAVAAPLLVAGGLELAIAPLAGWALWSIVTDAEVLDYLKAENAYFEAQMAPHASLVERLFEELKGRVKEDEASVPARDGAFLYWWAFETGGQYRKWWRRPVVGGDAELILDETALAKGRDYFRLGGIAVSDMVLDMG